MSKITQIVSKGSNMKPFNREILASGVRDFLNSSGPYIFCAASDLTVGGPQTGAIYDLLVPENKIRLTVVSKSHTATGNSALKGLRFGDRIRTPRGIELLITENWSKTSIKSRMIQNCDRETSNGTIQSQDKMFLN